MGLKKHGKRRGGHKHARSGGSSEDSGGTGESVYTVDAAVDEAGRTAAYAVIDPGGGLLAGGGGRISRKGVVDSLEAEKLGVLAAIEKAPAGAVIATDSMFLLKAAEESMKLKGRGRLFKAGGEVRKALRDRGSKLIWRTRRTEAAGEAHKAARIELRRLLAEG